MFDFPIPNTPPREKRQPDMSDLILDMAKKMVERLEQEAPDEKVRVGAGITLRSVEVKEKLDVVAEYTTKHREKVSIDTLYSARALLDGILSEISIFLSANPVPDETKPENT